MFEIDERVVRPDLLAQIFAANDIIGALEKSSEDLERLSLQLDPDTMLPQLSRGAVHFERTKSDVPLQYRIHHATGLVKRVYISKTLYAGR